MKRKDGVVRHSTSYQIDSELRKRLCAAGCNLKGGSSRIVEDCIRAYLPVIEFSQRKEKPRATRFSLREKPIDRHFNNTQLVPPEALLLRTDIRSRTNLCANAENQDFELCRQDECLRCALSYAFDRLLGEQSSDKGVSNV